MIKGIALTDIFIDCNEPERLRQFYHEITGWEKIIKYSSLGLTAGDNLTVLFSKCDIPHTPPVWPEQEGEQQKQIHFDFAVENFQAAVDEAIKLGAIMPLTQYGNGHWITLLDPEGHPFCFGVYD